MENWRIVNLFVYREQNKRNCTVYVVHKNNCIKILNHELNQAKDCLQLYYVLPNNAKNKNWRRLYDFPIKHFLHKSIIPKNKTQYFPLKKF